MCGCVAPRAVTTAQFRARVLLAYLLLAASSAFANDVLVGERARHPLTALVGIPNAATRSTDNLLTVELLHGNAFMGGSAAGESLILDGETSLLQVGWRHAISRCSAVSARLPFVTHDGGRFDSAIETWHSWFGLPNAGREDVAREQLLFRYSTDTGVYELDSAAGGLGDVSLWIGGRIGCAAPGGSAYGDKLMPWRAGVKLPTGDPDQWLGSGGTDVWADIQSPVYTPHERVRAAASVGVLVPGNASALPTLASAAAFGAFGMQIKLTPRLAAHASIDWNSSLFDSRLTELGETAAQLTTGVRARVGRATQIDLQITEDVFIDTASDIALRIAIISAL